MARKLTPEQRGAADACEKGQAVTLIQIKDPFWVDREVVDYEMSQDREMMTISRVCRMPEGYATELFRVAPDGKVTRL